MMTVIVTQLESFFFLKMLLQLLAMKNLNLKQFFHHCEDKVLLACRKLQAIVDDNDNGLNSNNTTEEAIDLVKISSNNDEAKTADKIVSNRFLTSNNSNHKEGEAALIIEKIRPYLTHCLVSRFENIRYD
jgi:hypothetical protein